MPGFTDIGFKLHHIRVKQRRRYFLPDPIMHRRSLRPAFAALIFNVTFEMAASEIFTSPLQAGFYPES